MRHLLLLLTLAACSPPEADLRGPTGPGGNGDTGDATPDDPPPEDGPLAATEPPFLSTSAVAAITDAIDLVLANSPMSWGAYVVDLDNGQVIYELNPDRPMKPASNTKLLTTGAALDLLGPDHRATVELWAAAPASGPTLAGPVVVLGQQDGSWSSFVHRSPDAPADRLASALARRGVRRIAGDLVVRGDFVHEPHRFGTLDVAAQRARAAEALRSALSRAGIAVDGRVRTEATLAKPEGLTLVHTWRGTTMAGIAAPINRISHNEIADLLARHLGDTLEGEPSYAGFETVAASWLADLGVPTSSLRLSDGSGLSHNNRVTARLIVELLAALDPSPAGPDFVRSLSVAGDDGTLAGRLTGPDTAGRFLGKTGTLRDTIATSGILHNRYDGHRYAVALLSNDVTSAPQARALHDDIIRILSRDWRAGGDRPSPPIALSLVATGAQAELRWEPGDRSTTTEVQLSDDGRAWRRERMLAVDGGVLVLRGLTDHDAHVRLVAVGPGGRSEPSAVLSVRGGQGPRVLLVDGNERWAEQPDNPLGAGHDFVARVARTLPGVRVDSARHTAILDGDVALGDYDAALWLLGEESTVHTTFDRREQALLRDYVDDGGALLASGSEIGWDLDLLGDDADRAFVRDVLGGTTVADSAETWLVEPAEAAFVSVEDTSFALPGHLMAWYPDLLSPGPRARTALGYAGGTGGAAMIRRTDARVAWAGFPVEAIDDDVDRQRVLLALLGAWGLR